MSLITCQLGLPGVIMALQPQAIGALLALGARPFGILVVVHGPGCELRHPVGRLSMTICKYTHTQTHTV